MELSPRNGFWSSRFPPFAVLQFPDLHYLWPLVFIKKKCPYLWYLETGQVEFFSDSSWEPYTLSRHLGLVNWWHLHQDEILHKFFIVQYVPSSWCLHLLSNSQFSLQRCLSVAIYNFEFQFDLLTTSFYRSLFCSQRDFYASKVLQRFNGWMYWVDK